MDRVSPVVNSSAKNKKLIAVLVVVMLSVFFFFQFRYHFMTLDHISWTSVDDGDITYQVDRLLLNAKTANYKQISSTEVDYGSELFLLAPVLRIINAMRGPNLLNAYYLISFVHILFGTIAVYLLSLFFKDNIYEKFLWIIVTLMSPLFGYHMGFIKPDANVVLFCIIGSLYFCSKKELTFNDVLWSTFFASFGVAIKWWSGFCLVPIAYRLFSYADHIEYKRVIQSFKLLTVVGALSFFPFAYYIVEDVYLILSKNNLIQYMYGFSQFEMTSVVAFCFVLLYTILYWKTLSLINTNQKSRRIVGLVIGVMIIFTTIYIVLTIPFVASGIYVRSVYAQVFGDFQMAQIMSEQRSSAWQLIKFWLGEFKNYHYLSPVLALTLPLLLIYLKIKKHNEIWNDKVYISLSLYLASFLAFIFLLLNRNNRAMIAMLYPLLVFLIFYTLSFLPYKNIRYALGGVLATIQIVYHMNGAWGGLYQIYFERDHFKEEAYNHELFLRKHFPMVEEFMMCDYLIPEYKNSKFKFTYFPRYYCKNNSETYLHTSDQNSIWIIANFEFERLMKDYPDLFKDLNVFHYSFYFVRKNINYVVVSKK